MALEKGEVDWGGRGEEKVRRKKSGGGEDVAGFEEGQEDGAGESARDCCEFDKTGGEAVKGDARLEGRNVFCGERGSGSVCVGAVESTQQWSAVGVDRVEGT